MLCSFLETPERAAGLHKPELSLLTRMKERGGVQTDGFMLNLLEHQVTRVESCVTTLQLRHMIQPFRKGVQLSEQARPVAELLGQISSLLAQSSSLQQQLKAKQVQEVGGDDNEADDDTTDGSIESD
jgi:adenylate cyclase